MRRADHPCGRSSLLKAVGVRASLRKLALPFGFRSIPGSSFEFAPDDLLIGASSSAGGAEMSSEKVELTEEPVPDDPEEYVEVPIAEDPPPQLEQVLVPVTVAAPHEVQELLDEYDGPNMIGRRACRRWLQPGRASKATAPATATARQARADRKRLKIGMIVHPGAQQWWPETQPFGSLRSIHSCRTDRRTDHVSPQVYTRFRRRTAQVRIC